MRLGRNQRCPIHGKFTCCGREERALKRSRGKWELYRPGVKRIRDEHAPTGWRYKLTPEKMRLVLLRKIEEQHGCCGICGKPFEDMNGIVPDHKEPKGMGGGRADDGEGGSNIQAAHEFCNRQKGSRRIGVNFQPEKTQ